MLRTQEEPEGRGGPELPIKLLLFFLSRLRRVAHLGRRQASFRRENVRPYRLVLSISVAHEEDLSLIEVPEKENTRLSYCFLRLSF